MPAPKWTKLTPDVRHNIVIEHVKKNGGAFSTFEKIAKYALLIVYALRLFVYILRLRSVPSSEWVGIWYLGSLSQALCTFPGGSGSQYRS